MTTIKYLDEIKAKHGLPSDYAAAQLLGLTRSQVSRYRHGKDHMSEETCLRVAALLELDAALVLASVRAESGTTEELRSVWGRLAERLRQGGSVAAGVILAAAIGGAGAPEARAMTRQAGEVSTSRSQLTPYTLARLARRARRALATLSGALSHGVTLGRAA